MPCKARDASGAKDGIENTIIDNARGEGGEVQSPLPPVCSQEMTRVTSVTRLPSSGCIEQGKTFRILVSASLNFSLITANILTKIVRESVFLSHHSVTELPYLYILVAVFAGMTVTAYSRYTANISLVRLICATNCIIALQVAFFWTVLNYFDPKWSHYAFYLWSAIAGAIGIAQGWSFVCQIFTSKEGERVFGLIAAGGTIGGAGAAFAAAWMIDQSFEVIHLLGFVVVLHLVASSLPFWASQRLKSKDVSDSNNKAGQQNNIEPMAIIRDSSYLKTMGVLILLSVIVSTLIDFEFKATAKEAHRSSDALAAFFSSYYGWLSIATFFIQFVVTGRSLSTFGLFPNLYLTPGILLAGSLTLLISPSLLAAALTRMADTALRHSIHRTSMEILYMRLPLNVRNKVKAFLDVAVERVGDAIAGIVILLFSLFISDGYLHMIHIICVALIFAWILLIPILRIGYLRIYE